MSADRPDDGNGAGCLFLFGIIIIGVCVGCLSEAVFGWLTVGVIFVIWAMATAKRGK